jgi:hypothetical protein
MKSECAIGCSHGSPGEEEEDDDDDDNDDDDDDEKRIYVNKQIQIC